MLGVLLSGAAACASGGPAGGASGDRYFVAGYHAYWTGSGWDAYPWDALDVIYLFELEVGADGSIADAHGWPGAWTGLLERAAAEGVEPILTVAMHDAEAFAELFSRPERVLLLVDGVLALLEASPELGGIHLDFEVFEAVDLVARDGYTGFVTRLAGEMGALEPSASLSAFAVALDADDVYDERALADLTDYLVVQGYDLHHAADERAGPLGATRGWGRLNWESVLERFLALGVTAEKIVMAVPLYGYEWPVVSGEPGAATRGEAVITPLAPAPDVMPELPRALASAAEHGLRRDAQSGVPFYSYRGVSGWRQGWLEDAQSLRAKYAFVRDHGLAGVALFPLAYGDRSIWDGLRSAFNLPAAGAARAPTR